MRVRVPGQPAAAAHFDLGGSAGLWHLGGQAKPVPEALPPAALARPDEGGERIAAGGDMGLEFLLGWFLGGPARPG